MKNANKKNQVYFQVMNGYYQQEISGFSNVGNILYGWEFYTKGLNIMFLNIKKMYITDEAYMQKLFNGNIFGFW